MLIQDVDMNSSRGDSLTRNPPIWTYKVNWHTLNPDTKAINVKTELICQELYRLIRKEVGAGESYFLIGRGHVWILKVNLTNIVFTWMRDKSGMALQGDNSRQQTSDNVCNRRPTLYPLFGIRPGYSVQSNTSPICAIISCVWLATIVTGYSINRAPFLGWDMLGIPGIITWNSRNTSRIRNCPRCKFPHVRFNAETF